MCIRDSTCRHAPPLPGPAIAQAASAASSLAAPGRAIAQPPPHCRSCQALSLIHISEPTRLALI
eukprot:10445696-Alexandrium_andersonii.AAC.1